MPLTAPIDLAPYMATIEATQERINNKDLAWTPVPGLVAGPCVIYAETKLEALKSTGLPMHLVLVRTEHPLYGPNVPDHMVLEIDGTLHGKAVQVVLDMRFPRWELKADLIQYGYRWFE